MSGDLNRVSLSPTDMRRLRELLQARPTPLNLTDVHLYADEVSGCWSVFAAPDMETEIYCMFWAGGVWEVPGA